LTQNPAVSVVIVSHGRPALLRRALIGVSQLFYRPFEVVVIADRAGLDAISDLPFSDKVKSELQAMPNISAARNQGVDLAAGEIVGFIDDDAVPEPTWLNHLTVPFADPELVAATGTVLGRNGISVQWGQRSVDAQGVAYRFETQLPAKHAVKLEGTNMAIRRRALTALGGFDPGFSFFLDETDLAWRLMTAGMQAGFAPLATVHHGYAESLRRSATRVPRSLFQIGASSALYLRKHGDPEMTEARVRELLQEQSDRVQGFVRRGDVSVDGMRRLLEDLQAGIAEGRAIDIAPTRTFITPSDFQPLITDQAPEPLILTGRRFQRKALEDQAERAAGQGRSTSLVLLAPTVRAHRVSFSNTGVWVQSGGLFGPSDRNQPRFRYWDFAARIAEERARLAGIRWI
jgi:GT2 family glycosyltransferase